jgi:hypothetical protein
MSQYNLTLSIAPYNKRTNLYLKFQFLTTMKMTIFRHMLPCTLMEVDGRFRDAYCFYHQDYGTTWHHIPNISHFQVLLYKK